MNKLLLLSAAGAVALLLCGCVSDGGYVGGDAGVAHFGWGGPGPSGTEGAVRDLPHDGSLGTTTSGQTAPP